MPAATDNLKASLARQNPVYSKTVELYRRIWNGTSYTFDATPVDITAQIIDAGKIMWKFDKEAFNSWTIDNTTLTMRNDRQQWKPGNTKGYFSGSYVLRGSKIRIKVGAQLADGTYEKPYVFLGYINTDPVCSLKKKTAVITVSGAMSFFEQFNAEDISTTVEAHPPSAYVIFGEDSGSEFTVGGMGGVGRIWDVRRGSTYETAAALIPKIDYSVTGLNVKTAGATITLVDALTAGENLYGAYSYWFQDKPLEDVVQRVMTLCGITSYAISPAVYSNSILNLVTYTSKADWDASTKSNIDTVRYSGSALLDSAAIAGVIEDGWTYNSGWGMDAPYWRPLSVGVNKCSRPTRFMGVFEITTAMGSLIDGTVRTAYLGLTSTSDGSVGSGLFFKFKPNGHVYVCNGYDTPPNTTHEVLDLGLVSPGFSLASFRMETTSDNKLNFYKNDVLLGTMDGLSYYSDLNYITLYVEQNNTFDCMVGSITARYVAAGSLTFGSIDTSIAVASYGAITPIQTLPAGTSYVIETRNSDDNSTWGDWLAVLNTGLPAHLTAKRYIQIRCLLYSDTLGAYSPILDQLTFKYYTSNTTISLVNLTGMNCLQLLKDLAEKCCYEMGFNAEGKFLFQPRSTTLTPVMDLTSALNVIDVRNVTDGTDRLSNYVEAVYGDYTKISDDSANTPGIYGLNGRKIKYKVQSSSLLPEENVYLAEAIAPTILAYVKVKRRRCQAETIFLPHLELADTVRLSYEEPTALKPWKWGDTHVKWGDPDIEYWNDTTKALRISFWKTVMRIEGIELEWWKRWATIFDLVEVV